MEPELRYALPLSPAAFAALSRPRFATLFRLSGLTRWRTDTRPYAATAGELGRSQVISQVRLELAGECDVTASSLCLEVDAA